MRQTSLVKHIFLHKLEAQDVQLQNTVVMAQMTCWLDCELLIHQNCQVWMKSQPGYKLFWLRQIGPWSWQSQIAWAT